MPPSRSREARRRYRQRAAQRGGAELHTEAVLGLLDELEDRAKDLSPAWPEVGRWFAARQRQVFGTANRGRWAPRKPSYIAALRRSGYASGGLLVRTGTLRALSANPDPRRSTARYAVFGLPKGSNREEVAGWLAKGRPSMPRRTAVPGLTAGERRDLARVIARQLTEGIS